MSRQTIPGLPEQVARARKFVRAALGDEHPVAETAALLTSELVTNSVLHSTSARDGTVTIVVAGIADLARVEVTDDGAPGLPKLRPASDRDESGHGLHLVDALAARWGCHRNDDGTTMTWFELTS